MKYDFTLEFNQEKVTLDSSDPSDFIYTTSGKIIATNDDEGAQCAGEFRVIYLDIRAACDANVSVFDMFDLKDSTIDYYGAIFEGGRGDFSDRLLKLFKYDLLGGNVLILDRLEILPQFRAQNLGLITMRRLIVRFSAGAELIAIKPFPLQCAANGKENAEWWERMRLADLPQNARTATAKLKHYYSRLGFKALPGTPFMFLSTQMQLLSLDSLYSTGSANRDAD